MRYFSSQNFLKSQNNTISIPLMLLSSAKDLAMIVIFEYTGKYEQLVESNQ